MPETVAAMKRLEVVAYDADGLGDRSYLLHDGGKAFVVDPQRDPCPYLETANDLGVDIVLVLETHVHNDYVSGGLALARRTSATYGVPAGVTFDFASESSALEEGDLLGVGDLRVRVMSTPGHTPHRTSLFRTSPRPPLRCLRTRKRGCIVRRVTRAAIAASILSAHGLRPVLVDDAFDNAIGARLEIL